MGDNKQLSIFNDLQYIIVDDKKISLYEWELMQELAQKEAEFELKSDLRLMGEAFDDGRYW